MAIKLSFLEILRSSYCKHHNFANTTGLANKKSWSPVKKNICFFTGGSKTKFRGSRGVPWAKKIVKKFFSCFQDQLRKSQEVSTTRSMNKYKKSYLLKNAGHYGPPLCLIGLSCKLTVKRVPNEEYP